jgi:hypothetical protein
MAGSKVGDSELVLQGLLALSLFFSFLR